MLVYYNYLGLDAGFEVIKQNKNNCLVRGRQVSKPPGHELYLSLHAANQKLICFECGLEASCFILCKGQNDVTRQPILDLFAMREDGVFVLMTRDHIIPKSLGGNNTVQNLRVSCSDCNSKRGNYMSYQDLLFMEKHPHLIRQELDFHSPCNEKTKIELRKAYQKRELAKRIAKALPKLSTMLALALL